MTKNTINKRDFLNAMACPTYGWHGLRTVPETPDEAALFRMEQGREVGELARRLFENAIFVKRTDGRTAAEVTRDMISDTATDALLEASFQVGPFVAKADILSRETGGWHLMEVKSNFANTSAIRDLVADLAYTLMVLRKTGLPVSRASLVLLSRDYRYGDAPEGLFEILDKTEEAERIAVRFEAESQRYAEVLLNDAARPEPRLIPACRQCPLFADECIGAGLDHTVLELPNLHKKKFIRLADDGIVALSDVPADLGLSDRQLRVRDAALGGSTFVGTDLRQALDAIQWPCHYLDFETVATLLPLYEGYGCHQQILTQFSVHHRDDIDAEITHDEYLADAARESEQNLAEALIMAVRGEGSIVVYSTFEKTRINGLVQRFPGLTEPLKGVLDRMVDIHRILSDHVYHPDFRGSFSIKNVLPALVPDLSYDGLEIADGDTAIAKFARLARGEIAEAEVESVRSSLFEYCKMDTMGMVRLHEALQRLAQ